MQVYVLGWWLNLFDLEVHGEVLSFLAGSELLLYNKHVL